jgi:hypothetical protein
MENYTPGDEWSWEEEEADLHETPCLCVPDCPIPGHYQKRLEEYIDSIGYIPFPVCLGSDGRVWDGHHRIVAAYRLGIDVIPVETD